jgi:hypothetical protein
MDMQELEDIRECTRREKRDTIRKVPDSSSATPTTTPLPKSGKSVGKAQHIPAKGNQSLSRK